MSAGTRHSFLDKSAWRGRRQRNGTRRGGLREQALTRDGWTCQMCGTLLTGTKGDNNAPEVDHIVSRETAPERQADLDNLQSLCTACHSGHKKAEEARGYSSATGEDGLPTDANHPFNRRA